MINWKIWEQTLRDRVETNDALRISLAKTIAPKQRHLPLLKFGMTGAAFAVLTIILTYTSPQINNNSFVGEALAAYEHRTQQLLADQVRHIVTTWSDGVITQARQELWQSGDGALLVRYEDRDALVVGGKAYASSEQIAEKQADADRQTQYQLENIAREPYRVELATGLGGDTGMQGNYFCARVESMGGTPESQEFDMTYEAILNAIGYNEGRTIPDTQQALVILSDADGVIDLGQIDDPDFGVIHRIRMTTSTRRQGSGEDGIDFDFLADPATTRLVRIRNWSFNPDVVNEATSITTFVTDEIIDRMSLADGFFDPETYGWVIDTVIYPEDIPDARPVYTVTESGCYEYHPKTQTFNTVPESDYGNIPEGLTNVLK